MSELCGCRGTSWCSFHAQQAARAEGARRAAMAPASSEIGLEAARREWKQLRATEAADSAAIARGESDNVMVRSHERGEHQQPIFGCPACVGE